MGSEHTDEAKGRIKEAAGDLTNNEGLQNEGKVDQGQATIKDKISDAADKVKDMINKDKH